MPYNNVVFVSHKYDVNPLSIYSTLEKKVNREDSWSAEISEEEYLKRVSDGLNFILKDITSGGLTYNNTDVRAPCLSYNHNMFMYWLAMLLITKEPSDIKLCLDWHFKNRPDSIGVGEFSNQIEYFVLEMMNNFRFSAGNNNQLQVAEWVRGMQSNSQFETEEKLDFKDSKVFHDTFAEKMYSLLAPYVEDKSKEYFKNNLYQIDTNEIVVFKVGFKKIMLIAPMRALLVRNKLKMNKKNTASWISTNFRIGKGNGYDSFSEDSVLRTLAQEDKEPQNGKIKFLKWF